MNMKAPLFEQNLAIFIQALTLSESWVLSHEPQSTPIQTKSGHFHTNSYPLGI
jgi:hypothetical protein